MTNQPGGTSCDPSSAHAPAGGQEDALTLPIWQLRDLIVWFAILGACVGVPAGGLLVWVLLA